MAKPKARKTRDLTNVRRVKGEGQEVLTDEDDIKRKREETFQSSMNGFGGKHQDEILLNEGLADKIANSSETTQNRKIQNVLAENRRTFTFEKPFGIQCNVNAFAMHLFSFICVIYLFIFLFFNIFDIAFQMDNVSKIPYKINNMKCYANILKIIKIKHFFKKIKFGLHIFYFKRYISIE